MKRIIERLSVTLAGSSVPIILFTKGGGQWLPLIADTGAHAIGIDWTTDIRTARSQVGGLVALQAIWIPQYYFHHLSGSRKRLQIS